MAGFLNYGAGAHAGIDEILDRQYKDLVEARLAAAQQENARHNQAEEGYQLKNLDETSKLRTLTQQGLEEDRHARLAAGQRDDYRLRAGMRNAGDVVSPEERSQEVESGAVPTSRYKQTQAYQGMSGDDASEPVGTDEFSWIGATPKPSTGQTQTKNVNLQGKDVIVQETPDGRLILHGQDVTNDPTLKPYQAPDRMLVPVAGPGGTVTLTPRSGAAGMSAPEPMQQRTEMTDLNDLSRVIDDTVSLGEKTNWAGIGPVQGSIGATIHRYTGADIAGGDQGETLRNRIDMIRTLASFERGGKNLTPTERQALDDFLAKVTYDPVVAAARLKEFQAQMKGRVKMLDVTNQGGQAGAGAKKVIRYDQDGNEIK